MDDRRSDQSPRRRVTSEARQQDSSSKAVRRVARRVTPRSAQGVLLRVIQEVLDPHWSPARAARSVIAHVGGEVGPLRAARAQILAATFDRSTVSRARALATINLAIAQIEAAAADHDARGAADDGGPDHGDEGGATS